MILLTNLNNLYSIVISLINVNTFVSTPGLPGREDIRGNKYPGVSR